MTAPLAALAVAAHAWFPFVGEPVADDFDFLHHAFFAGPGAWLDGGGSQFYWRPVARQLYYRLSGGLMLAHPMWIAVFQAALLALAALLLYRALRPRWPAAWAATAASFPFLLEAGRALISTPTSFQDLGAILFSALALQQAAARRLAGALAALLTALLCKEMAVVTVAALPLVMPTDPRERRARVRWAVAVGILLAAWGLAYWLVVTRAGLWLARDAIQDPGALAAPWPSRYAWALTESLRDAMNLAALGPMDSMAVLAALGAIAAVAIVALAVSRPARARTRRQLPWLVGGLAWFALATATLADVYPYWRPYRSPFGAIGLGVACAALLGAVRPLLLAALVVVRLAAFALSPGPPAAIADEAAGGVSLDYPKLVRLQRLVGETRRTLLAALPPPARDARVAAHYYPQNALHAFAGDRSLWTWYRDTTLRWVTLEGADAAQSPNAEIVLEFQPTPPRQVVAVHAQGLWHLERASQLVNRQAMDEALRALAVAESLQHDPAARLFTSLLAGVRGLALAGTGRLDEAEREAARGLALWRMNFDARYALAVVALRRGRLAEAETHLDTLTRLHPKDPALRNLLEETRRARERSAPSVPIRPR